MNFIYKALFRTMFQSAVQSKKQHGNEQQQTTKRKINKNKTRMYQLYTMAIKQIKNILYKGEF